MLHVTPDAEKRKNELDAVIFDMDGVLLDITGSIRVVNCLAVPFYLREVLGWPAPDDLLTSADIELFKHAGGFNDDWDLTYALVLHFLVKGHEHPDDNPATLNVLPPTLRRYTALIKERGGWLRAAEEICFEGLSRQDRLEIEAQYRKNIIRQVFQELLAGEHCQRLYGFPATLYKGRGLINNDKALLDLAKVPADKKLGVQTGRTYEEAMLGMEFTGLDKRIPETLVVTKRDGFHKPQPGGLALLAERLGFRNAIYIGDTLDDLRTVHNFNAAHSGIQFLSAQVLTGPAGAANESLFRSAGADVIAPDVNTVLDWLAS
ncbi:MAG: HAD-IA family hydrolase [Armatimonadetes bacterium]|nr:HAD-IA family hydrolase [Armatimonadota bacterium]